MDNIIIKLQAINDRFDEVALKITDPNIIADMKKYVKLNKEYKDLEVIVETYHEYRNVIDNIDSSKDMIKTESDPEFKEMAKIELNELETRKAELDEEIKVLLIPKDPEDNKNAIMELRAGTGGDEACLFVADIFRMYTMYFKNKGWKYEIINSNEGTTTGYKEISLSIEGEDVFVYLKFESGVHRVQIVPETESQGRVHTSAMTVAIMPEAEEVDVVINKSDIKKDTYRASGAGGQHVNKTESAVRLTHLPTNTVVECQDGRSQIKNYEKALSVLRSRIYEKELEVLNAKRSQHRKLLISTGDRSAKIRTYNYPQGRVTDHRINLTLYNLSNIMNGEVQEVIDSLKIADTAEKMKEGGMA